VGLLAQPAAIVSRPPPLGTAKIVLAITVKDTCLGETSFLTKTNHGALRGAKQKQGIRCRASGISSRWAAGRSYGCIGRNGRLDRSYELPGH
jgi:hypothetical protein